MRTILVPIGGAESDDTVLETAYAVGRRFDAHLEFLHIFLTPGEAAAALPESGFAVGPALGSMLDRLQAEALDRSAAAARHVGAFCARRQIPVAGAPGPCGAVTASWQEELGEAPERLLWRARRSDLVVTARPSRPNGLPADLLELLLLRAGRPLLLAPPGRPLRGLGTVVICWKEAAEAARAVAAALPLLGEAERVVVLAVAEGGAPAAAEGVAGHLAWHGIAAEVRRLEAGHRPVAALLAEGAAAAAADLVVMGGFGVGRVRQALFGGCTRTVLDGFPFPVLLAH
jgi:nucleotide-binding universal stress UspA family protein